MKSLRFYKLVSIILLVLNLGTLAFFYFTKPPHPPKPGEQLISNDVGMEGKIKLETDRLEMAHHKKKQQLMHRNFELHRLLYSNIDDTSKSRVYLEKIHKNQVEIEKITYQFFYQVSEKCTPEQRKKLDQMLERSLRMLMGQGPPKR